jgi:hypothetical protein
MVGSAIQKKKMLGKVDENKSDEISLRTDELSMDNIK